MHNQIKIFAGLAFVGAIVGVGKLLQSNQPLTCRLVAGRTITGSAVSTVAGFALVHIPDMPFSAVMALGSALGILGAEFLEQWMKKAANKRLGEGK